MNETNEGKRMELTQPLARSVNVMRRRGYSLNPVLRLTLTQEHQFCIQSGDLNQVELVE